MAETDVGFLNYVKTLENDLQRAWVGHKVALACGFAFLVGIVFGWST